MSAEILRKSYRIMAFGKTDRRRDVSCEGVLLHEPLAVIIPPFGAVEDIVKPRTCGLPSEVRRVPECLRKKKNVRICPLSIIDEPFPKAPRQLIGGVAPESPEAELCGEFHNGKEILIEALFIPCVPVVELGEVFPDYFFPVFVCEGMCNPPF